MAWSPFPIDPSPAGTDLVQIMPLGGQVSPLYATLTSIASAGSGINQLTGDVTAGPGTGSQATTLATVNTNVGSFTYASITVNGKGLITAASNGTAPISGLTTGTVPKAGSATTIVNSSISDNGTRVTITEPLTLSGIPTADPHIVGAVWANSGVLTLSAG